MSHLNQEVALTVKIEGEAFASWDGLDDMVVRRIADHFISDHGLQLRQRVNDLVNAAVTDVVQKRVEAFLLMPIPAVDRFGQPIPGAVAKSLGDMIADAADAALTETVDPSDGKPMKKDAWGKAAVSRLEWLVKRVAVAGIAQETEKAVKAVNAEAKAAVQKQVAASIAAHLVSAK